MVISAMSVGRIVRHLGEQQRVDGERPAQADADGVAVGLGLGDHVGAGIGAGARPVLDHERLAERLLQMVGDQRGRPCRASSRARTARSAAPSWPASPARAARAAQDSKPSRARLQLLSLRSLYRSPRFYTSPGEGGIGRRPQLSKRCRRNCSVYRLHAGLGKRVLRSCRSLPRRVPWPSPTPGAGKSWVWQFWSSASWCFSARIFRDVPRRSARP